jgi:hypothetical protein
MSVEYTIKAIPMIYKGRQYRSRLEAKWAAFFDLLGWTVEYEPADFGKWSPDFAIICDRGGPIFVEVKPIQGFSLATATKMMDACHPHAGVTALLLVGVAPFLPAAQAPDACNEEWMFSGAEVGWNCFCDPVHNREWSPVFIDKSINGRFDIYWNLIPGGHIYGEDQKPDECPPFGWRTRLSELKTLWAQATNTVQWHARGRE